jgi:hypothetical protein
MPTWKHDRIPVRLLRSPATGEDKNSKDCAATEGCALRLHGCSLRVRGDGNGYALGIHRWGRIVIVIVLDSIAFGLHAMCGVPYTIIE